MDTTEQIVEEDEYFLLPLDGREVTQCRVDSDISVVSWEPSRDDVVIRVASFRLTGGAETRRSSTARGHASASLQR